MSCHVCHSFYILQPRWEANSLARASRTPAANSSGTRNHRFYKAFIYVIFADVKDISYITFLFFQST